MTYWNGIIIDNFHISFLYYISGNNIYIKAIYKDTHRVEVNKVVYHVGSIRSLPIAMDVMAYYNVVMAQLQSS